MAIRIYQNKFVICIILAMFFFLSFRILINVIISFSDNELKLLLFLLHHKLGLKYPYSKSQVWPQNSRMAVPCTWA